MRKEISPEMYNYNKFPGPEFIYFDQMVKSDDYVFTLLENQKEAFNATSFSQRFSEILLKYDYIVGDWGNEQLRLKGFYKDDRTVKYQEKISRLEDYLKEYCNFGCGYFVLKNDHPIEIRHDEDRQGSRKKRRYKSKNQKQNFKITTDKERSRDKRSSAPRSKQSQDSQQHFTIRKKEQ